MSNELIQELTKELKFNLDYLKLGFHMGKVLSALYVHCEEALKRQWKQPDIRDALEKENGKLELKSFWPYWMSKGNLETIKNDITIKDMVIFTGPNMAGN